MKNKDGRTAPSPGCLLGVPKEATSISPKPQRAAERPPWKPWAQGSDQARATWPWLPLPTSCLAGNGTETTVQGLGELERVAKLAPCG